eukprot:jgi/Tetstr1/466709/TSEL_011182.t1
MMAHTHRHHRYFFRLLSARAWLYTEMIPASQCQALDVEALRFDPCEHPVALQLGGHDVEQLATATRHAAALGYDAVNLNCGCPSPHVTNGARRGGAAMMREPDHVAACVTAMLEAAEAEGAARGTAPPLVTVKHRLSVVDDTLSTPYDAAADHAAGYDADLCSARGFIETVSAAGVTRFQVHARKGLLSSGGEDGVWVPSEEGRGTGEGIESGPAGKVDHKREAARKQKHARARTLANRSVPPLRPEVVHQLAREFPHLELVSNGGVNSMADALGQLRDGVHGVMVGRAAINHPVLFAGLDEELYGGGAGGRCTTRGEVLDRYIEYVEEEERARGLTGLPPVSREGVLRKLVSPPFSLFVGEAGCDRYQRRIRNMAGKFRSRSYLASDVLRAARTEVQMAGSFERPLLYAVPLEAVFAHDRAVQRAGSLQRMIA